MSEIIVTCQRVISVRRSVTVDGRPHWVTVEEGDARAVVDVPSTDREVSLDEKALRAWAAYYEAAADAIKEANALKGLAEAVASSREVRRQWELQGGRQGCSSGEDVAKHPECHRNTEVRHEPDKRPSCDGTDAGLGCECGREHGPAPDFRGDEAFLHAKGSM